jgi:hypothetical protein
MPASARYARQNASYNSGPIYLQASEKGTVAFRNIVVTPATD